MTRNICHIFFFICCRDSRKLSVFLFRCSSGVNDGSGKSLAASKEIYFRSAKIDSVYRKHEGYKYFRFVKKLDDVELSSNPVEGSDSLLVIVDDRYKLPDCEHLVSLSADTFPFILIDSEEDASLVV